MSSETELPSRDPLAEAEAACMRERAYLITRLQQLDDILAKMRALRSVPRAVEDGEIPPVAPYQFNGMKISPALDAYLKARRGFKIPIKRVVEDLQMAGADLGGRPQHNLKITMRWRPDLLEFDPKTWTMWLAETADIPSKKLSRHPSNRGKRPPKDLS